MRRGRNTTLLAWHGYESRPDPMLFPATLNVILFQTELELKKDNRHLYWTDPGGIGNVKCDAVGAE